MKKESIAKLRRIVKDPVRFIDESLDTSTLFFIKYLQNGFWFSLAIVLCSITSVLTSHAADQNLGPELSCRHSRISRSNSPAYLLNSESFLKNRSLHSSSAVLVKGRHIDSQVSHGLKENASIFASFAARARRFPMSVVISVRPTDLDRKVSTSFSLKFFDKACYKSVFSDAFLDASGRPIVSYGIYLDTYSATRPLWTRLCRQENMVTLYQGLSGLGNTLKNYFSDQSSGF